MSPSQNPLWTCEQATSATGATGGSSADSWNASGVSINTRTLAKGDLFVALIGPSLDGHDYVSDAFDRGAAAAAVSKTPAKIGKGGALLMVEDTQLALENLGRAARERANRAKFIAVTGSVGKTGVKEALASVLKRQGIVSASEGSLNNHWGLPLSLSRVPSDADFAVLEMGMNHAGELTPLSHMARPHVCVVTTVQPAHTEHFASLEKIADAKAEIFAGAEPGAIAVLHRDIAQFDRLQKAATKQGLSVLSFGCDEAADVHLVSYDLDPAGSSVSALINGARLDYRVGIAGRHWVMNSLCVLAAVVAAGGDVNRAAQDLANLQAPKGRGQRFEIGYEKGNFKLIDESYNASPASMKAALEVLSAE
ncbi:MAG: UDP-N-acetylmuramoyl-tripeptide--D-alanyl-D-alanine ligase, partial [Rhodospirillaceae bacterium]|nr:UDP-N-acetylmuramoyl-tripeptide--D-alanyl-D-alanine ligase [Rhodospirillaceae bacterium]